TGYTCGELFLQDALLEGAKTALHRLVARSEGRDEIVVVGLPFRHGGKLYNVAAVYSDGVLRGLVPKTYIPNYGEFYELRHFASAEYLRDAYVTFFARSSQSGDFGQTAPRSCAPSGESGAGVAELSGLHGRTAEPEQYAFESVPFGTELLFECEEEPEFVFAAEICEDLWVAEPPSVRHAQAGAKIIVNPSAGNETIGKASYRRLLVNSQSGRLICGYVYANAGFGESSTDLVFAGHCIIGENGVMLAEALPFGGGDAREGVRATGAGSSGGTMILSDIDLAGLARDRRYRNSYHVQDLTDHVRDPSYLGYETVFFSQKPLSDADDRRSTGKVVSIRKMKNADVSGLCRRVDPHPFVPANRTERTERCEEILNMQSSGLAKRLLHTGSEAAILGISGGLDSTLALLVSVRAMRRMGKPSDLVVAVTMPGFGTTDATRDNARRLCELLGVSFAEIDIRASVTVHLESIGRSVSEHDVVFENAQARVRTLVLMDMANQRRGLVVGTGDLSELALGWSTYNGDHMSMYGVNAGVPKTLVRHIIRYVADTEPTLSAVLNEILDTPVSPELLPPEAGSISQKTEDLIGPYELHDFFLYHMVRWGRSPGVILKLAKIAFCDPDSSRNRSLGATEAKRNAAHGDGTATGCGTPQTDGAGSYDGETIKKWLKVFYRRFFAYQFKRSALPDGPKIGSVSLSPRGDWRMPSDAEVGLWLAELERQ
ncbi:MAG: NAD(+) synthase, partial [Clostridiales Family XIII bacterium]|nr:NAD(+) synthase [Clostridiales Family XIII bacterium]